MFTSFTPVSNAIRESTERWVEDLFLRSKNAPQEGRERRFVFPTFTPLDDDKHSFTSWWPAQYRILRATTEAFTLFQEALRLYGNDFERLLTKTLSVTGKNAGLRQGLSTLADPSFLSALAELTNLFTDMTGNVSKESISYWSEKASEILPAMLSGDLEAVAQFWEQQVRTFDIVVHQNPRATEAIQEKMGFRFEDVRRFRKVDETDRTVLYQVLPLKEDVTVRASGKPNIHLSPFILPENILDLLPYDGLTLVGAFANSGSPTYFVHVKDILTTPAVQVMTEEELLCDVKRFAHHLHESHRRKVTLCGTCQGALPMLHAVSAPKLAAEEDVDAWVGIVPAYALAHSPRVKAQMDKIPPKQQDLGTITERLASGNVVVVGEPSSLSMRLGDFDHENPMSRLIGDIRAAEKGVLPPMALALRAYLGGVRPMPLHITAMSQQCATKRMSKVGAFPHILFGEQATLQHAIDKGIYLHVVAGGKDNVVDPDAALAMFQFDCVKKYSKATHRMIEGAGHVAVMTTCTREAAKNFIGNEGGPLWFHLGLEKARAKGAGSEEDEG